MSPIAFDISPEISIILCTYNRAHYLNKAIDSVLSQTFTNWELLIVDDGSNDNTFEIVNSYLDKYNNLRYLKHQNKKQCYAKNAGIQASFGKYITFIDSDDAYLPNHLESRLQYMQNHPDVDLIEGGFAWDEDILLADFFQPGKMINLRDCVLGPTFFGKRKVFFELQGFKNLSYAEDAEFWARAEQVLNTHKLSQPETYIYSRGENSITKAFTDEMLQSK